LTGKNILIRQASQNNYEGEGMEIDEFEYPVSLGSARNFKSMLSMGGGDSVVSSRSRSSRSIPVQSLDDSFVVRNVNFERHSSEILRSLSNEDLYWSHHVETLGGEFHCTVLFYHSFQSLVLTRTIINRISQLRGTRVWRLDGR
jgi:hypothetical protein